MVSHLLVFSDRQEDHQFLTQLSEKSSLSFLPIHSAEQLEKAYVQFPGSITLIDLAPSARKLIQLQAVLKVSQRLSAPNRVFGITDQTISEFLPTQPAPGVGHFLTRPYTDFALIWLERILRSILQNQNSLVDSLRDPLSVVQTITLKSSREKGIALEAFQKVFKKEKIQSRAITLIVTALDEILMNAIYDAPRDPRGRYFRREVPRSEEIKFGEFDQVTIQLVSNPGFMLIGVTDLYGSLDPSRALFWASQDFKSEHYQVNQKTIGAGLGLMQISVGGISLYIRTVPKVRTEAVLAFPYFRSMKEASLGFRSFSVMTSE